MVYRVSLGTNPRLERALESLALPRLSPEDDFTGKAAPLHPGRGRGRGRSVALHPSAAGCGRSPARWKGAAAAMVADGSGELYTKSSAQALALACSMAGACLPGRALVEATGSLYNHHIQAANRGLSWEETYFRRVEELAARLETFAPPRFDRPRVLMLHASDQRRSNTLALGRAVLERLSDRCDVREIGLLNGTGPRLPGLRLPPVPPLRPEQHLLLRRAPVRGGLPGDSGERPAAVPLPQLQRRPGGQPGGPHQPDGPAWWSSRTWGPSTWPGWWPRATPAATWWPGSCWGPCASTGA